MVAKNSMSAHMARKKKENISYGHHAYAKSSLGGSFKVPSIQEITRGYGHSYANTQLKIGNDVNLPNNILVRPC